MLLADGGVRVTWECGCTRTEGAGSGEWSAGVDMRVLEENVDQHHAHRHHAHVPHRTKVSVSRT